MCAGFGRVVGGGRSGSNTSGSKSRRENQSKNAGRLGAGNQGPFGGMFENGDIHARVPGEDRSRMCERAFEFRSE